MELSICKLANTIPPRELLQLKLINWFRQQTRTPNHPKLSFFNLVLSIDDSHSPNPIELAANKESNVKASEFSLSSGFNRHSLNIILSKKSRFYSRF